MKCSVVLVVVVSTCEWALLRPPRGAAGREFERWPGPGAGFQAERTDTARAHRDAYESHLPQTGPALPRSARKQVHNKSKIRHTDMELKWESLLDLELMTGSWRCFLTTRGASISCRKVCMLRVWSGFLMGVLGHGSDRLDTALQCRNHRCACEEEGSTTLRRTTEDSFESHSRSRRIC